MQLSYRIRECTRTFACQLTLYPRLYIICRDVTSPSKTEKVNESEYTVWKKRNAKAETRSEVASEGGRSFWLRRLRRIHGRASFSKVSAQECYCLTAEWELGESMSGTADRLPKKSLPFVLRIFFPPRRTMEIGKKVPLFDYAENYRNFRCLPLHVHDTCTVHGQPSSYRSTK